MRDEYDPNRRRPYTTSEAAAILGVSQRTVIRWCEGGLLEFFWTPGHGKRRILAKAVKRLADIGT